MKISRRDFLKGSATTLFLAGFNFPVFASSSRKKKFSCNYVERRNGWPHSRTGNWRPKL